MSGFLYSVLLISRNKKKQKKTRFIYNLFRSHKKNCLKFESRFCSNFSSVFATASYQSVRVWSLTKKQELLRIIVPNFTATAVMFAYDGQSILTAWDDGVIRAFTPITGKLIYAISNAHNKGQQNVLLLHWNRK